MKLKIKNLLQQPEVKELTITLVGISAGFVANKLLSVLMRRNIVSSMVGKLVQVGVTSWIASHPEWIENTIDQLMPDEPKEEDLPEADNEKVA